MCTMRYPCLFTYNIRHSDYVKYFQQNNESNQNASDVLS